MLIAGERVGGTRAKEVRNPYDGSVIDTVPLATDDDVAAALDAAERGALLMERLPRVERAAVLARTAAAIEQNAEELALLLAREVGKTIREARGEVARTVQTFKLSGEEARRLAGEVVPFDGAPTGVGRFGFTLRVPVGIVVAITPFNFPLNLSAHKIGPAIAAGNAVILKPATATPLACLRMGKILIDCGLPPEALSVVTGSGSTVGDALVTDARPRVVTFTGSAEVGRRIMTRAGLKKCAMELGSNSAVIVEADGDVATAAERSMRGAFALAGQVCISVQRVLVQESVLDEFLERAVTIAASLKVGDQLDEGTDVGPMIDEEQAVRAESWIAEGAAGGAVVRSGGARRGTLVMPAVLTDVSTDAKLWRDEAFAPVVCVRPYRTLDEAIDLVNEGRYGLQAGIYTESLETAMRAAHEIRCGGVMVNDVPSFRVDLMPYGGEKESGLGREGPKYAVEEMSELRVVGIRRSSPVSS
ncbi:aldehyde dehydrogenase family protein [bacterium]|nr:aldehyde dehydrogenase family protein [bacterium]